MGLFSHNLPKPPQEDLFANSKDEINNFSKRIKNVTDNSKNIKKTINQKDSDLEFNNDEINYELKLIKSRFQRIKKKSNILNNKIKNSISIVKQLARNTDYEDIKDKIKRINLDELITINEFKNICQENINNFIKSQKELSKNG